MKDSSAFVGIEEEEEEEEDEGFAVFEDGVHGDGSLAL